MASASPPPPLTEALDRDATAGRARGQSTLILSRRIPEALYSDAPLFAAVAHMLDRGMWDELPAEHRWTPSDAPEAGYGFVLACLPHLENAVTACCCSMPCSMVCAIGC